MSPDTSFHTERALSSGPGLKCFSPLPICGSNSSGIWWKGRENSQNGSPRKWQEVKNKIQRGRRLNSRNHDYCSRSFSTWASICVFLSKLIPYTFIQKPVSTEVKVWSLWLWWSKENSPFEELRLHLHGDRDWKDSEWEKTHTGPKNIMRLTKAAWWVRLWNHACVFSSFSHTQITYKFLMAALVLSGANTYHAYLELCCQNKKE